MPESKTQLEADRRLATRLLAYADARGQLTSEDAVRAAAIVARDIERREADSAPLAALAEVIGGHKPQR
jgi:hypothetical protein